VTDVGNRRNGKLDDFIRFHAEHDFAERGRSGVVDMDDGPARALEGIQCALDDVLTRLGKHLDGDIGRNVPAFDEIPHKVELGLRGSRKADLDFLETDLAQNTEQAHLAFHVHRLEQRLVSITQISAHPDRRTGDHTVRPLPLIEANGLKRMVLGGRAGKHHGVNSFWCSE